MTSGTELAGAAPAVCIDEPVWERALRAIAAAEQVVLACHVSPDGDALGSMLALALACRALGKPVAASYSGAGAGQVPPAYDFLPGRELLVAAAELPAAPDLLVTLDTPSVDRLAELAPLARAAGDVLVVDHHERGDGFGTIRLVDAAAAATAVVVFELVNRLGVALDADIATCVYTGLTTDTGSFKYAATTPAVHQVAARLLATGMRHDLVARSVWDTRPYGYIRLLGAVCARARLEPAAVGGRGLVWTWTTAADLAAYDVTIEEIEGVIDLLRTTAEAEVAVVCKQDGDGAFKVSTRSKGAVDLGRICASFGGGGHRFAAGYTSPADLETTMAGLRAALAAAPVP